MCVLRLNIVGSRWGLVWTLEAGRGGGGIPPQDFEISVNPISLLDAVTSSGILKAKQKLGIIFNSDKLGGIDFTKFSKLSMCSAGAGRCWPVLAGTMAWASS